MATKYASLSPYNFSFNDPVSFTDVTGADPLSDLWTIIDRLWNEVPMDGGQTWSSESGFSGNYSSLTAFYVGANYNSQNNFWGGVDGGAANFDRAAQSYGAATGYVPLREVDVRVSPLPSGSWFTGEPYYASQTWLHDRLTEATFDYGTWLGGQYHDILDDVGLVPIIGDLADGINAIAYLTEGDYVNAGISTSATLPFVGWFATGSKLANRAHTVYTGIKNGKEYVGITVDLSKRYTAAQRQAMGIQEICTNVPGRDLARGIEQTLINEKGLGNSR